MGKLIAAAFFCLAFAAGEAAAGGAGGAVTSEQVDRLKAAEGTIFFDNWLFFQKNSDDSEQWKYQARIYFPFDLPGGWTFTQRADLPVSYTDKVGTDNPTGGWKAGIGDWFIEEIITSPQLTKNFSMWASVRFVFPRESPFGTPQYEWAPAVGASYAIPEHGITIDPVARYFVSYHATESGADKVRELDLFPIVKVALPNKWSLSFYPENAISYNAVTHKWFVPIDLMLGKWLTKTVEFGIGGAYALVKDDPQFNYTFYARLAIYI